MTVLPQLPVYPNDRLPALPEHLHDQLRLNWYMTQWCNYSCDYCPVLVFHKRTKSGQPQPHAFDYYPVDQWLQAFDQLQASTIHLHITGGEPFLDRQNFRDLLHGLSQRKRFRTCISTNGFWDPAWYKDLDKSGIFLDIGFHPSQTNLDTLIEQMRRIRDGGFKIAVVNYVLSPENIDLFDEAFARLSADGQYVQVSTMFPSGVHLSRDYRTDRELEILVRHNTPLDLHYKLIWPPAKKRLCYYPAMNYQLSWDGRIQLACFEDSQNLFEKGFPELPRTAVACPRHSCYGCVEMFRAFVDEPLYDGPIMNYTHEDMAAEISAYRRDVRAHQSPVEIAAEVAALKTQLAKLHDEQYGAMPTVPVDAIQPALPDQPVIGYVDATGDKFYIEARSRDRVMVAGWVASTQHGAPMSEVRLKIGDKQVGSVREFYPRPDVAVHFGRQNWLMSGWRTMVFLPSLPTGEHGLVVEAVDSQGNAGTLAPWPVRIIE